MNHLCVYKFDEKKSWSLVLRNQMHMMNNEDERKKIAIAFPQESCRTCSRSNYPWELQKTNKTQQRHCTIEAGWRCWCKNVSTDLSTTLWRWLHWESWACLWLEFYLRWLAYDLPQICDKLFVKQAKIFVASVLRLRHQPYSGWGRINLCPVVRPTILQEVHFLSQNLIQVTIVFFNITFKCCR